MRQPPAAPEDLHRTAVEGEGGNFGRGGAHYRFVRGFANNVGLSLAAHVLMAAAVLTPRLGPKPIVDPAPQIAGETFELPAPETPDLPLAGAASSSETTPTPSAAEEGDAPARPSPGRPSPRPSHATRPIVGRGESGNGDGASGSSGNAALYGAVGERGATDLATAFTRGFPQAASADSAWRSAPLGSAGEVDVVLGLDEGGRIEGTEIVGNPSAALTSGIRRTLALLGGRAFVARSKTTKLHLAASVSADSVHDGLHGDVFAIGGSFAAGEGNAFFALAIGRRIDVRVRVR